MQALKIFFCFLSYFLIILRIALEAGGYWVMFFSFVRITSNEMKHLVINLMKKVKSLHSEKEKKETIMDDIIENANK